MTERPDTGFLDLQQALAGRYSIEGELGRGGMGIVYLAREVSLDRPVALKLLPPALASRPAARERFLHEARTAAKLSHPNIVPIFTVDEVDNFVFFAMAYVDGETLGQRIRDRGPRPPSEVARILREVAWALAYAHAQGVVHRDVKPDNILLESGSGRALVADFGIASVVESTEAEETQRVSGTAEFMSPEQARGEPAGPASDAYSLGIVGFYALTGKLPFEGSTAPMVLAKHISEPAPPVGTVADGVPGKLARTIDRCLVKNPTERFPDDQELAEALSQTLEARRELPVALRVFVKRESRLSGGTALLYFWLLMVTVSVAGAVTPTELKGAVIGGILLGGVTIVPAGLILHRTRKLLKSGYGQEEVAAATLLENARAREEGEFEFGEKPSLYEKAVRGICAGSFGVAALSGIASAVLPGTSQPLTTIFAVSLTTGIGGGALALVRLQKRRDIDGQLRAWFWRSRLGRWVFKVAGVGLKPLPAGGSATYRPTEFAIGMAADRLFEELPRQMRRQLSDLPDVVRKLEADAQKMRMRVEELNQVLAEVGRERPASQALAEALPSELGNVEQQRRALEEELLATRDATQQRLADAVAALETIRLSLLRMQAGSGSVESLTGDLVAARDVADDIDQLLDAHHEVDALLKPKS